MHREVFKAELHHLIDENVLQRIYRSEWSFSTFLIPKKDGRVRWISDFCCTKIDKSMGFDTFQLDSHAQQYCVISTPFGLYKYLRLPMGLTNSPDVLTSVIVPSYSSG